MNDRLVHYVAQALAMDECKNTEVEWSEIWTSYIHQAEVALRARKEFKRNER